METSTKEKQHESRIHELEESIRESNVKELLLRTKIANARSTSQSVDDGGSDADVCSHSEAQLVSLATAFLVIHPDGARVADILGYVREFIGSSVEETELVDVLVKNGRVFRCREDGDEGARWGLEGFGNFRG